MLKIPGITLVQYDSIDATYLSRGFEIDAYQLDGLPTSLGRAKPRLAMYERVEVLRGAGGLLNGAGDPGGSINLVRKRPGRTLHGQFELTLGSWNQRRALADVGGALTADAGVRGRVVVEHLDTDRFYKPGGEKNTMVYGLVEADLAPGTKLTVGGSYVKLDTTPDWNGLPRYSDGGDLGFSTKVNLGAPWARIQTQTRALFAELSKQLGSDWKLDVKLNHSDDDGEYFVDNRSGSVDRATGGQLTYGAANQIRRYKADGADAALTGAFQAWGRRHDVVLGAGLTRSTVLAGGTFEDLSYAIDNVFNYNPATFPTPHHSDPGAWWYRDVTEQKSLYALTRLRATDAATLLLGLRHTRWHNKNSDPSDPSLPPVKASDSHTSPFAGVVYGLGSELSA